MGQVISSQKLCEMVDPFGKLMLRHLLGADIQRVLDIYRGKDYTIITGVTEASKNRPALRFMDVSKNGWHLRILEQNTMKKSQFAEMARNGLVLCWAILTHPEKCPMPYWICYMVDPKDETLTAKRIKPVEVELGPLFKVKPEGIPAQRNLGPLFDNGGAE